ncbi:dihydrolipoamide acetyltransferase component of pyruvate dehydrogenase complex [Pseudoclavibacter endophyticus]|uniref:Dihydrolipoamide acetyltransferase component of pyruvate dehydrogenase complex n=1 Tax=Pseudoclavibacter endophyticus TaxID=1778590 RepID=A0A6H9WSW1_9MICO|nr:2-oxoglutarate dehydrogenase, E2 component, dihydrolipoamide succinyltransferase [Pseudoclavibacter endophyticus]KAB1650017.1 2-oxoglutarate dehydrogenase, E2 component, dihydrolipoamide succinyltransferase [Pseudoclavibacter endophyticus]GGA57947.1 dihydrolipoamide acetyltransferase component of pyruvate dehydrogenase complex [Pseudoclavibacter endophyticus]
MSEDVKLPALGESVTEGTVTRWLKSVGDTVEVDEALLEVSTDKVDTEIPSPVAGVVEEILVDEDETAEVGAVLARVGEGSGQGGDDAAPEADSAPAEAEEAQAEEAQAEDAQADEAQTEKAPDEEASEPPTSDAPAEAAEEDVDESPAEKGETGNGASQDVTLPALGESVTEGTVTRWLKSVGDTVEVDEALLEVSTDKVDTEVPSPVAGTLQEILVGEDETAEVGAVLARVGSGVSAPAEETPPADADTEPEEAAAEETAPADEDASEGDASAAESPTEEPAAPSSDGEEARAEPKAPAAPKAPAEPKAPSAETAPAEPKGGSNARYVTPIVRKLASELGVDLETVTGSGIGGRIRKEDVQAAAESASKQAPAGKPETVDAGSSLSPAPVEVSELRGTRTKMSRLRKVISTRAVESMTSTAQLTSVVEVDVTRIASLRSRVKDAFLTQTGNKLSFLPFFTLAAIEALQTYPIINATVDGDEIVYPATENVAMAVDTERGLLTPVIKDAATFDINGLTAAIADLAARTRDNKLVPDELAGGTFTVTNTGSRGALFDTPVVFLPQSAILGTGIVAKRPAVVKTADGGESIAIRSLVYLALSYDHRIIDGADAARFLSQVKARLEEGAFEGNLGIDL